MQRRLVIVFCVMVLLGSFAVPSVLAQGETADVAGCLATPNGNGCQAGLPLARYQMLLDEMLMHPQPDVRPLPVNMVELSRFAFRRLVTGGATPIYNGPNGATVGSIAPGFNYITVHSTQAGWVEMNPGQWVREGDTAVARPSTFAGVLLEPEAMEYTMAWVLIPSHPAPFPGAAQDASRPLIQRYTRVNIFESVEVDGWRWYLIGPDTWIKQTLVSKVVFVEKPPQVKGRWVAVDLYEQTLVAYEDNTPVFATLISSGLPQWATNEGTFQTWARLRSGGMSGAEGQTDFYSLENVPWTLYFDGAISLHGTYWHDGFGYRHSHGCVNLTITDSHWVFQWTLDGGYDMPWVHVFSSGEYSG
ncbi:MAG: L,D-transpeptidase [Anaerolineae bacterium]|nr:L,D-transpeptidase [Anaerolineae bacterium]